jgi:hypothetical protein
MVITRLHLTACTRSQTAKIAGDPHGSGWHMQTTFKLNGIGMACPSL